MTAVFGPVASLTADSCQLVRFHERFGRVLKIDGGRAQDWIGRGARPSVTVRRLIEQARQAQV